MNKREYILHHFYSVYSIPENIQKDLSSNDGKVTWHDASEKFFSLDKPFLLDAREEVWKEQKIPFPFPQEGLIIEEKAGKIHINFDVITASFMILSGWQEDRQKGLGSRLSHRDTWQYRYKVIRIPVVNYYFDVLKSAIEKAWNIEIRLRKEMTTVFLSHDIEKVKGGWKKNLWPQMKSFEVGNVIELLFKRFFRKDIWNNLEFILRLEESYEVRSTVFLMGRKGKKYADYDLHKAPYSKWVKEFQGRGFEVGILSSNGCHNSAHKLGNDLKQLKYKIYANRFQSLRYRTKKSPRSIQKNKLKYDSSLGLYNEVGFRNGYCHPFIPWDFENDQPADFVEIPVNIVDSAMAFRKYLNITAKDSVNVFSVIAEQVAKFKGVVGLSWSNEFLSDFENKEWRKAYERILKAGFESEYQFKTGYQILLTSKDNGLLS